MALLQVNFKSLALHEAVQMNVLLPDQAQYPTAAAPKKYPVLYLLHGLSDDHTIWERRTRIEHYVAGKDLIVVMPNSNRCWYTNTASGLKYFDLMAYELPRICKAYFPVAEGRENTFVAGLSMGGYGAFKLALTLPEQYAAAVFRQWKLTKDSFLLLLCLNRDDYCFTMGSALAKRLPAAKAEAILKEAHPDWTIPS